MRTLSADGLKALLAESTGDVFVAAVTITHESYAAPIRIVADTQNLTYGDDVYTALPFEVRLAADVDDEVPTVQIVVDNIERSMIDEFRTYQTPPTVQLEIFRRYKI